MRGHMTAPIGTIPVTLGAVALDLTTREPAKLVPHGVYRRPRDSAAKLAQKLPDEAKKLVSDYPSKRKK